jgi:hypothetical protein
MKALLLAVLVTLLVATPVAAGKARPFISVDQEQIIIGEWFTVTYRGSDYARVTCKQSGVTVFNERVYLVGEGGKIQITPVIPYIPATYTPCTVDLVKINKRGGERVLASDAFQIRSPV